MQERNEVNLKEYNEVQRHEYKGVSFFTAIYNDHIVLEPIHEEVMSALSDNDIDSERIYSDSAHTWSRHMSLLEQRNELIRRAQNDIDYLLSGESLKELREKYLHDKKRLEEQLRFFKVLKEQCI